MICIKQLCRLHRKIHFIQSLQRSRQYSSKIEIVCGKNTKKIWPKRIFSGIQPTGGAHLGNYFGAIKRWVDMQNSEGSVMISVVDLHSITQPQSPEVLRNNILEMTATLLACGIDPEKSVLFLQSLVPRHAELAWILTCITTMARISHLPQYKEKSEGQKEPGLGLLLYPVLQAADILLYKSTHVPVGEDQEQQLQMAQQLVKSFNHRFGVTFPTPHAVIANDGTARLKSLRDPMKKMSKSDPDPKSRIQLTDTPEIIKEKIKKAVTDFTPTISYDVNSRPGVSNLIQIHCLLTDKIPEEVCEEVESLNTVGYKMLVGDLLCNAIEPIRSQIQENLTRPKYLREVLEYGASKARPLADMTYHEVCNQVGIGLRWQTEETTHILNI